MRTFKKDFSDILHNQRMIIFQMVVNLLLSIILAIYAFVHLNPDASVVKVGYGDIGGYRDGSWVDMLAYPLLAIIFGILHSLLAVRIYHRRGGGMVRFFLLVTTILIIGAFITLVRLLGEG